MTDSILARVMLAFEGETLPEAMAARLARAPAAGVTLFRHVNVRSPGQVRELAGAVQRAGGAWPGPLLIAADQEGGQFIALGDESTQFAGNMALGAVDDIALTERVGRAIGTEARAMGVNVIYAPVLDVASNPVEPGLGHPLPSGMTRRSLRGTGLRWSAASSRLAWPRPSSISPVLGRRPAIRITGS